MIRSFATSLLPLALAVSACQPGASAPAAETKGSVPNLNALKKYAELGDPYDQVIDLFPNFARLGKVKCVAPKEPKVVGPSEASYSFRLSDRLWRMMGTAGTSGNIEARIAGMKVPGGDWVESNLSITLASTALSRSVFSEYTFTTGNLTAASWEPTPAAKPLDPLGPAFPGGEIAPDFLGKLSSILPAAQLTALQDKLRTEHSRIRNRVPLLPRKCIVSLGHIDDTDPECRDHPMRELERVRQSYVAFRDLQARSTCGDGFVAQTAYGGRFVVSLIFVFADASLATRFDMKVQIKKKIFGEEAVLTLLDFDKELIKDLSGSIVIVRAHQEGGDQEAFKAARVTWPGYDQPNCGLGDLAGETAGLGDDEKVQRYKELFDRCFRIYEHAATYARNQFRKQVELPVLSADGSEVTNLEPLRYHVSRYDAHGFFQLQPEEPFYLLPEVSERIAGIRRSVTELAPRLSDLMQDCDVMARYHTSPGLSDMLRGIPEEIIGWRSRVCVGRDGNPSPVESLRRYLEDLYTRLSACQLAALYPLDAEAAKVCTEDLPAAVLIPETLSQL